VTMNVVVQAAWSYLLHRHSGEASVVFGATVSGRPAELAGVERMLGLFINTVPVRVELRPDQRLHELLKTLHQGNVDRSDHGYVPLMEIQAQSGQSGVTTGGGLFESLLVFQNYPMEQAVERGSEALDGLRVEAAEGDEETNYPLALNAHQQGGLTLSLHHRAERYAESTVERLLDQLALVLAGMASQGGEGLVSALPWMEASERHLVLRDWNATAAAYPTERCIHQLFEEQAARTPESPALVWRDSRLSYRELDAEANRVAHGLRARGVGPDVLVGLCMERSVEMVVGLLGILKAGGAYVPLDPGYPPSRLAYMLEDSGCSVVLSQEALRARLGQLGIFDGREVLALDGEAWSRERAGHGDTAPDVAGLTSRHLAYVIYTSGSTGQPKGVLVGHGAAANYVHYAAEHYGQGVVGSVVSLSLSFDATVTSLFVPLVLGLPQVLLPEGDGQLEHLSSMLWDSGEALLFKLTPSHLEALSRLGGTRASGQGHVLVVGGEQLHESVVHGLRQRLPSARIVNEYGPTEATVGCSVYEVGASHRYSEGLSGAIPIGRPIANTQLYVLDGQREPVPVGVVGEIYIGGVGVARGYLHKSELTAERFVADPFSGEPEARLYRTGDLARWLPDGNLAYVGRSDTQVKIRGYRIELGEIEARLASADGVAEVVVVVVARPVSKGPPGDRQLVAYYTGPQALDARALREHAARGLPDYMVPAKYVRLSAMPLLPNGKLDRRMLPDPRNGDTGKSPYRSPRTAMERYLCMVYAEALRCDLPGINDDFFAIGGHSLSLLSVHARLRRTLMDIPLQALYEHRCVADLAAYLRSRGASLGVPVGSPNCVISLNESSCTRKLFIVHPLLGVASPYTALAAALADVRRCYGVQAPDSFEDWDLETIAERVAFYADAIVREQPEGPYDISGWSSGGWLAYEVAVELARRGAAVASMSILDVIPPLDEFKQIPSTYYGPIKGLYHRSLKMDWAALDGLDEAEGIERVLAEARAQALIPAGLGDNDARRHFRYLRNWAYNLNTYETSTSSLNLDVYISRVSESPGEQALYADAMHAVWRGFTDGDVHAIACEGDHGTMVNPPHLASLAEAMRTRLAASDARSAPVGGQR
jgi:surfactin family lipopeptide synthetase C